MKSISLSTESLAFRLLAAARAVASVRQGTALPQALETVFRQVGDASARGAVQDISYRTMRSLALTDALCRQLASRPPKPVLLHSLLSCALTLLLPNDTKDSGYDAFTVVDQAVDAAAADSSTAAARGMVNAVLRRFLRETESLLNSVQAHPQAAWNYPAWWIRTVQSAYPESWEQILRAGNHPPPLTLRVNRRLATPAAYMDMLDKAGIGARIIGPTAVRLNKALPVERIPGFSEGMVSVQDAAAQLAGPLLDVRDGMRVLDACAAPGGKTGHLLELADLDLTALDQDSRRLSRIGDNLRRLNLQAKTICGDAASRAWWDGRPYDRILADVPCTASGIVRRHPDIRWLRRPEDAERLAAVSRQILDNVWQMLRPDGKLLLVTCSIWPEESEMQAAAFAQRQPDAERHPATGQLLPADDALTDHDGLFLALFRKKPIG